MAAWSAGKLEMLHLSSQLGIPRGGGRRIHDTSDEHVTDSGFLRQVPNCSVQLEYVKELSIFPQSGMVTNDS
jgi:hypothetical protein